MEKEYFREDTNMAEILTDRMHTIIEQTGQIRSKFFIVGNVISSAILRRFRKLDLLTLIPIVNKERYNQSMLDAILNNQAKEGL